MSRHKGSMTVGPLSEALTEVARLVAQGDRQVDIARKRHTTQGSAGASITEIRRRLGLKGRGAGAIANWMAANDQGRMSADQAVAEMDRVIFEHLELCDKVTFSRPCEHPVVVPYEALTVLMRGK